MRENNAPATTSLDRDIVAAVGTAASKVFAIPELLETILLYLGQDCHGMYGHLFVLQRVNQDFRNTINGSAKLRRAMVLLHNPGLTIGYENGDYYDHMEVIRWLSARKVLPGFGPGSLRQRHKSIVSFEKYVCALHTDNKGRQIPAPMPSGNPTALLPSWRDIKLSRRPSKLTFRMPVQLTSETFSSCEAYTKVWRLAADATAGQLSDRIEMLRARPWSEIFREANRFKKMLVGGHPTRRPRRH